MKKKIELKCFHFGPGWSPYITFNIENTENLVRNFDSSLQSEHQFCALEYGKRLCTICQNLRNSHTKQIKKTGLVILVVTMHKKWFYFDMFMYNTINKVMIFTL